MGTNADIYLFDNISTHLDYKTRVIIASIIRKYIIRRKKTLFIIDNDLMVLSTLAKEIDSSLIVTEIVDNTMIINNPRPFKSTMKQLFNISFHDTVCMRPILR